MYVAIWFYIATVVTVAVLHIVNSIEIPVTFLKSYPVYAGVQDALVQWWYGHNAVAFFLTTPYLGLMYYFLPKAADRPVYSYRLSIIHFWSLIFLYIWAGPHHLLYTALPDWAQSLGTVFSIMLLAPSWGGMINGLLTLRGAWDKVREDAGAEIPGGGGDRLRHVDVRRTDALAEERQRHRALHRLDRLACPCRSAGMERVPDVRHSLLAGAADVAHAAVLAEARQRPLLDWHARASSSTRPRCTRQASPSRCSGSSSPTAARCTIPNFLETVLQIKPLYIVRAVGGSLYLAGVVMMVYQPLQDGAAGLVRRRRDRCSVPAARRTGGPRDTRRTATAGSRSDPSSSPCSRLS